MADDFHLDAGGGGYREALLSSPSCAHSRVSRSPGRRQPEETRSRGWALRSCTEVTVWGSQVAEQNGSSDGQEKWRADQS